MAHLILTCDHTNRATRTLKKCSVMPVYSRARCPCLTVSLSTGFHCRCGEQFCSFHRYADQHSCSFDYKTSGREELERKHPRVVASKIQKLWSMEGGRSSLIFFSSFGVWRTLPSCFILGHNESNYINYCSIPYYNNTTTTPVFIKRCSFGFHWFSVIKNFAGWFFFWLKKLIIITFMQGRVLPTPSLLQLL